MSLGKFLFSSALTILVSAAPSVLADDTPQGEGRHVFVGQVNANAVMVRSRASEDAYATTKLNRGTQITVVGIKGNWLKIVPPEGSFAYVPKTFVTQGGDGTQGKMNRDWIARAGSDQNDLAAEPLAPVHAGDDVQIIGQHNEYFKIVPPKDSYLWINKQFVDPVSTVLPGDNNGATAQTNPQTPRGTGITQGPAATQPVAEAPATQPAESSGVATSNNASSTTQPSNTVAEYERLEAQFTESNNKMILDQPLKELLAGYQKVLAADDLPPSMRRIAEIRVEALKVRSDARDKYLAVRQEQQKMDDKEKSLVAERQEIEERLKQNDLVIYTAVGTLRSSSLQVGQGMLYRLTDPETGRTVAYLRTSDPKFADFLGQFIGVRGQVGHDSQLKSLIENPSSPEVVEPAKLNSSVAAQIIPPSMVHLAQARVQLPPTTAPSVPVPESKTTNGPSEASTGEPQ